MGACALDTIAFAEERLNFQPDPWQAKVMRSPAKQVLLNLQELFEMSMGLRCVGNRPDGDYAWSPATAKGVLELVGKELG